MGARTRHAARTLAARQRLTVLLAAALASTGVVIAAAVASPHPAGVRASMLSWSRTAPTLKRSGTTSKIATPVSAGSRPPQPATSGTLVLTARDLRMCPRAATACVDLTRHLTWLQSGGRVSFGPVRMEPGPPGSAHATPRGTFQVSWKAGPHYISTIYHDPMPWAVFFAPGGVAFHGGSLTVPSHGCVHLTVANAHYYNEHLAVGAEVVVF